MKNSWKGQEFKKTKHMSHTNYHFEDQRPDENVILLLRKHWLTHLLPLVSLIIVFIVPILTWFLVINQLPFFEDLSTQVVVLGAVVWFLLGIFFIAYHWLDWYLDIYVVTDQRVIDITQNGLFHRIVGETSLDNIQDVIYEIKGFKQTLFNYGNVMIHTAGPSGDIVFEEVEHPQRVQRVLLEAAEHYKDLNNDSPATPEDLLNLMLGHQRERILKEQNRSRESSRRDSLSSGNSTELQESEPTPILTPHILEPDHE
jgi:hypothetical protein